MRIILLELNAFIFDLEAVFISFYLVYMEELAS